MSSDTSVNMYSFMTYGMTLILVKKYITSKVSNTPEIFFAVQPKTLNFIEDEIGVAQNNN